MKQAQLLVVAATVMAFLATFFIANGIPTGLVVSNPLKLDIDEAKAYQNEAIVSWSTNKETLSTIVADGERTAFTTGTKFSKTVSDLQPGTRYEFVIRACDASACAEKTAIVTTKSYASASPITGAVTGGAGITEIVRTSVNIILYSLLGIAILVVAGRVGYEKFVVNRTPLPGLIKKASQHLENDEYGEAYQLYSQARQAFMELEEDAKLNHYNDLLQIYQSLKRYSTIKEAQTLTEKYESGTITKEELNRLSELLAS